MSGRFMQLVFAVVYLAMLCLALFIFSGCSSNPPPVAAPPATPNQVDMKVEIGQSNSAHMNTSVTVTGRQLQKTVHTDENGITTEVTNKFRPGEDEPSERETLTSSTMGKSRTIEVLNANGLPRELKTRVTSDPNGEPTVLYRHAKFTLTGKIQWQEFYNSDGSVRQSSKRTKDGGMEHLCTDDKKQAWLLKENSAGEVVERFDYPCAGGPVREYSKWGSANGDRVKLIWRRWYDNGTLEVESIRDDEGYEHQKWYRTNGKLKIAEKHLHHKDRDMDCWEEYYKPDGKTVWRKREYINRVSIKYQLSETGTVEVIERRDCKTGGWSVTALDPKGRKRAEVENKTLKVTPENGGQSYEISRRVRFDKMDSEGRLSRRYVYSAEPGSNAISEVQLYQHGVLIERRYVEDGFVVKVEIIGKDGKVTNTVEVAQKDRERIVISEEDWECVSTRSYDVEETMPDRFNNKK